MLIKLRDQNAVPTSLFNGKPQAAAFGQQRYRVNAVACGLPLNEDIGHWYLVIGIYDFLSSPARRSVWLWVGAEVAGKCRGLRAATSKQGYDSLRLFILVR